MNKKKVIAFSLYGQKQMYQDGAIENSILVKKYYPDWECRFYVSQEISKDTIDKLISNGAKVIQKFREDEVDGTFWRFSPMSEKNLEALIVRDSDSRILQREVDAVDAWLNSGKKFHIMRDNPGHVILIPAGMFGVRGDVIKDVENLLNQWKEKRNKSKLGWANKYGLDQLFLAQEIYPVIKNDVLIHSESVQFGNEKVHPFPNKRENNEFVGEAIDTEEESSKSIDFKVQKLKKYPNAVFYYSPVFMAVFEIIKKMRKLIRGKN
ncbi:MAG: hypothetical protein PHH41_05975 [Sulfurimonas sp.]|nr:hypothetical protein [Sulfurimonas sp.]